MTLFCILNWKKNPTRPPPPPHPSFSLSYFSHPFSQSYGHQQQHISHFTSHLSLSPQTHFNPVVKLSIAAKPTTVLPWLKMLAFHGSLSTKIISDYNTNTMSAYQCCKFWNGKTFQLTIGPKCHLIFHLSLIPLFLFTTLLFFLFPHPTAIQNYPSLLAPTTKCSPKLQCLTTYSITHLTIYASSAGIHLSRVPFHVIILLLQFYILAITAQNRFFIVRNRLHGQFS